MIHPGHGNVKKITKAKKSHFKGKAKIQTNYERKKQNFQKKSKIHLVSNKIIVYLPLRIFFKLKIATTTTTKTQGFSLVLLVGLELMTLLLHCHSILG